MMKSIKCLHLAIVAAIIGQLRCSPIGTEDLGGYKLTDVPTAINYIDSMLPDEMTLEEKCKRYAILSRLHAPKSRIHKRPVSLVLNMQDKQVNQEFENMGVDELIESYMTLIDNYRGSSRLAPPFLDLIECLSRIDDPNAEMYLHSPELVLIVKLYKRILERPDTKIDLREFDLNAYHPAFVVSLRLIFKENLEGEFAEPSTSDPSQQASRQEPYMITSQRHRELERLRKQRLKILRPEAERFKATLRQRKRRGTRPRKMAQNHSASSSSKQKRQQPSQISMRILDTSSPQLSQSEDAQDDLLYDSEAHNRKQSRLDQRADDQHQHSTPGTGMFLLDTSYCPRFVQRTKKKPGYARINEDLIPPGHPLSDNLGSQRLEPISNANMNQLSTDTPVFRTAQEDQGQARYQEWPKHQSAVLNFSAACTMPGEFHPKSTLIPQMIESYPKMKDDKMASAGLSKPDSPATSTNRCHSKRKRRPVHVASFHDLVPSSRRPSSGTKLPNTINNAASPSGSDRPAPQHQTKQPLRVSTFSELISPSTLGRTGLRSGSPEQIQQLTPQEVKREI